jgi:hypothetical protein
MPVEQPNEKTCRICGETKPRDDFYRRAGASDGLFSKCKACAAAYTREWRRRNPEKVRAQKRRGRARQPEYQREYQREFRRRHPDRTAAWDKDYYERNPEKVKAKSKVLDAKRAGRLVPPTGCEACGSEVTLHAHHWDYSRPLDVKWLCPACHHAEHIRLREVKDAE